MFFLFSESNERRLVVIFFSAYWNLQVKHLELELLCGMNFDNEPISMIDTVQWNFSMDLESVLIHFVFSRFCQKVCVLSGVTQRKESERESEKAFLMGNRHTAIPPPPILLWDPGHAHICLACFSSLQVQVIKLLSQPCRIQPP